MKQKLYSPDIECDSCIKVLDRVLKKTKGINSYKINKEFIDIDYDANVITLDEIIKLIRDKGYRASTNIFVRPPIRERLKEFFSNKTKYHTERSILKTTFWTFILLMILSTGLLLYLNKFNQYFSWVLYTVISIVSVGAALWHYKTYKANYTCMLGMMIGMTLGMQSGMMIGIILGATNGFFIGAIVSMIIGAILGAWAGTCCGIMGVMEGLMAAVMGGTMGPMISVMMFTEHLDWFMPPYMVINILILLGMIYMIFEEVVEEGNYEKQKLRNGWFITGCIIIWIILMAVIFIAPKSIFMGGVL